MKRKIELDKLGICTSMLCMVHCVAVPILLISGVDSLLRFLEQEAIEVALIGLSLAIGLVAFVNGYLRHRQHFVPVLFVAGFLLLVNGHSVSNPWISLGLSVAGALVIVYSHIQNLKWRSYVLAR